jgi:hypothetical protein
MPERNIIALVGKAGAGVTLTVLGCLGILRDVGSAPPAARPQRETQGKMAQWGEHARRQAARMELALRTEPKSPELHLKLARFLYMRAAAIALHEYQLAFPQAFSDGNPCEEQYEAWRRGWFARDREGHLRRALAHAERAADSGAAVNVRVASLQLAATILRERGRERSALAPLLAARRIAPADLSTALMLRELRRRLTAEIWYPAVPRRPGRRGNESAAHSLRGRTFTI